LGNSSPNLLRCSGATVIGADLLADRRAVAARLGAAVVLDPGTADPAEEIKRLTSGRGADVCVEASGSARALHAAIRSCAYSSRVVALGFYQGEATGLFLSPDLQHRWDRQRLVHTFMQLALQGSIQPTELVTHRVPVADAPGLYRQLDESPSSILQAVLDFSAVGS
jgi:threonine dehydrogenase-like Zn-dependent dehydrogenase